MVILAVEWHGVLDRSWNSDGPLVFTHVILTNTFGIRRAKEIRQKITRRIKLWRRYIHAGLVADAEAEGDVRESMSSGEGEEKHEDVARSYYSIVL